MKTSLLLHVNAGDELPIYRQLVHQVADAIAGGRLDEGDRLPSHRELAVQLVIAPLTVKKAYDELEREGLISTQRGRGTFVSASIPAPDPQHARERLRDPARRLFSQATLLGVSFTELVELLKEIRKGMNS